MKKLLAVALILAAVVIIAGCTTTVQESTMKKFSSCQEMKDFLANTASSSYGYGIYSRDMAMSTGAAPSAGKGSSESQTAGAEDYSTTNIQVEGVDEPDIVKNDGKYIYVATAQNITIVDAFPAQDAKILSRIEPGIAVQEIFVNGDKLIVFGSERYFYPYYDMPVTRIAGIGMPIRYEPQLPKVSVMIYDITDRENPVLANNITADGSYYDSRMIGNYVYVIVNNYIYNSDNITLPVIMENGAVKDCACGDVFYFDTLASSYMFTNILSINVQDGNVENKLMITDASENMYVSAGNIYITYVKYMDPEIYTDRLIENVIMPIVPSKYKPDLEAIKNSKDSYYLKMGRMSTLLGEWQASLSEEEKTRIENESEERVQQLNEEISREYQKTVIHRIEIDNGNIEHKAEGSVSGFVLNQFSMDEYQGNFRIATTIGQNWFMGTTTKSKNNVYVLDSDLNIIGRLEDLAPGESIYSARFMGEKAYLVTFKKIDPFFVIDLSDPQNPKVLGKLKLPGYSNYLHPYDENHIIGIGKETVESESGDFAWYQGVKVSLFDVSDLENPKEVAKLEIGDRGTDSEALYEHKAFLFSKEKGIIVIPILLAEVDESDYSEKMDSAYGEYVWQGAYVISVTQDSLEEKGRITHVQDDSLEKSGYYWYSDYAIKRSLYMDDTLYTISDKMIKMNNLADLSETNSVEI